MRHLGIIALLNFNEWDRPNFSETGGVNSFIKNILPFLKADKIILYGITYEKNELFKEKKVNDRLSIFPIVYKSRSGVVPNRILGFAFGWRLKKALKMHNVNFVYSHSEEFAFWLRRTGVNYIHHLHTYVNALAVSSGRLAKLKFLQRQWERIRKYVIINSFKSVAINDDISHMLEVLITKDRVIRFSNYVDQEKFKYTDSQKLRESLNLDHSKVILFIGRIAKVKGMELFVDILKELRRLDDKSNWRGLIVGNGEYEISLKNYIQAQQLTDNLIFTGSVNSFQILSEYYSLADVFLITSFSESVPLTLLESLSCGTPVVSTNVGIAKNVLGFNNGFVVSKNEASEMVKLIMISLPFKSKQSILNNPQQYSVQYASNLLNKEFEKYGV